MENNGGSATNDLGFVVALGVVGLAFVVVGISLCIDQPAPKIIPLLSVLFGMSLSIPACLTIYQARKRTKSK